MKQFLSLAENQSLKKTIERDSIKEQYCKEKEIKLITIKYNENINDFLNMSLKFND